MTVLTFKSTVALTFVSLTTVLMTACNSGQPTAVETQPSAAAAADLPVAQPAVFKGGKEPSITLAAHYDVAAASALATPPVPRNRRRQRAPDAGHGEPNAAAWRDSPKNSARSFPSTINLIMRLSKQELLERSVLHTPLGLLQDHTGPAS